MPLSPHGALPEVPPHSGPAAGSDQGCPQSLPHGTASPVPTCALAAPWPRSRAERWDSRSCHQGWHSHAPLHPQGLRAHPAAPLPWQLPRGTGCAWDPPPGLTFHARSFQINILEPCRGGAGTPLALSSLSIPPGTAVTCPHGDLLPASAPCPVLARQWLLLNQRRGPGCARGDFLSPCDREELGESPGSAPPAWGHDGSRRLAGMGRLGVPGVLEGPIFPQGSGGLTGCFGDLQPSPGSGVSCVCRLVPRVPPAPAMCCPRCGCHGGLTAPSPGTPGRCPLPVPCLATLCPAALVGTCPTSHPLHIPLGPPGPASAGLRHRGERPRRCLRLPAALLCFQEEKKQWKFSCIKRKKKNPNPHVKRFLVFIINILIN